ncbi:MAG: hypothetical protein IJ493_08710 [Clostridia bacterium]|nr:hypothetical protein [Clostridia bacterium]
MLASGVPAGTKFDGETVTFLNSQYHSRFYYLLDAGESNGDTINDAVYNRNVTVQEKLGVKFEFVEDDNTQVLDKVRSAIMSDDDQWDIILGMQYRMTTLTLGNLMYDLVDAPYIGVNQPWWAGDYISNAQCER